MKKVLLAALALALASSPLTAEILFFSGNLEANANFTACGTGCTLNPTTNTIYDYATWAAVVYDFTVYTTTTMEAITYSYGGGTSLTGVQVASGGLEPYLSLFDSTGDFLDSTYLGTTCPAGAKFVGSNCFDVELNGGTLTPGTYQISISDYANASYAENNGPPAKLADGFDGLGDLQTGENLNYAFDVILPTNVVPAPEPTTLFLTMAGLAAIAAGIKVRKR